MVPGLRAVMPIAPFLYVSYGKVGPMCSRIGIALVGIVHVVKGIGYAYRSAIKV